MDPEEPCVLKPCGKRRKCGFSTLSQALAIVSAKLDLLSANAFNLVKSKILMLGKLFTPYLEAWPGSSLVCISDPIAGLRKTVGDYERKMCENWC